MNGKAWDWIYVPESHALGMCAGSERLLYSPCYTQTQTEEHLRTETDCQPLVR